MSCPRLQVFMCLTLSSISGCGGLGSQTDPQEATAVNAKVETTIEPTASGTLSISQGSAKGTEITVPANATPNGEQATYTLDRVEQPSQLSKIQTEKSLSPASKPIEIVATDANGNKITQLAQPMAINIPYSENTTLWLQAVEKVPESLCAILVSDGQLFVWRNTDLTIDITAKKVSFKSKNLGIFQLFYCAAEEVASTDQPVAEASEAEIIENNISFTLSFDGATYNLLGEKLCLVLMEVASDGITHTAVGSAASTGASGAESISLSMKGSDLTDGATHYFVFMSQIASHTCAYTKGATVSLQDNYVAMMQFATSKAILSTEGGQSAAFGTGSFGVNSIAYKIGQPGTTLTPAASPAETVCLTATSDLGLTYLNTTSNTSNQLGGQDTLTMYWPNGENPSRTATYDATIGASCQAALGTPNAEAKPYRFKLNKAESGVLYLFPMQITVGNSQIPDSSNVCVSLFTGDILTQLDLSLGSKASSRLVIWSLINGSTYSLFAPYDSTNAGSDTTPIYDFHMLSKATCPPGDDELGLVINDQSLNGSISL